MEIMKNLFILEWRKLLGLGRGLLIFEILMIGCMCFGNISMKSMGYILFLYFWFYGSEAYSTGPMTAMLPVKREQVVLAKYPYCMTGTLAGALLVSFLPLKGWGRLEFVIALFGSGSLFLSVLLPVLLYFGPQKGRLIIVGVYALAITATTVGTSLFNSIGVSMPHLSSLSVICFSLGMMLCSFLISTALYRRRDI